MAAVPMIAVNDTMRANNFCFLMPISFELENVSNSNLTGIASSYLSENKTATQICTMSSGASSELDPSETVGSAIHQ